MYQQVSFINYFDSHIVFLNKNGETFTIISDQRFYSKQPQSASNKVIKYILKNK